MSVSGRRSDAGESGAIALFRRGASYASRDHEPAGSRTAGTAPVLSIAPSIMIDDDARWLRGRLKHLPPFHAVDRRQMMTGALARFIGDRVEVPGWGSQSASEFRALLWTHCGLPEKLTDAWSRVLGASVADATPVVQGGLQLVSLPSNTFLCLESCVRAALWSDALWIRPSRREPFAAARFVGCLLSVGWPRERIALYPTRPDALAALVKACDSAVVYGRSELPPEIVVQGNVELRGPGRARALLGAAVDSTQAARWLIRAIADNAGRFCTSVGTILADSNVDAIAASVAASLDKIVLGAPADTVFPQAVFRGDDVATFEDWLNARLRTGDQVMTQRPICVKTGAGEAAAPTLIRLAKARDHPLLGIELPFPAAVIAEVSEASQPALCHNAGFVYALGRAVPSPATLAHGARATAVELSAAH